MASYIWSGAAGGNWSDPANWTPNGVPGGADTALVNLAGSYAIALDVPEIGSLTLDAAGVTVTPTGLLKLDGTLDVKSGTLTVAQTIQGGTLVADGGTIDYAGGTLDGVTLSGPLDLTAAGSSLTIEGGIGFTGPGPEQILETGAGSTLTVSGFQTLDNVAVTIDNSAATALGGLAFDANSSLVANEATLTDDGILDNKGTISLTNTTLAGNGTIENEGTLSLNGDRFNPSGISSLANTGTVNFNGASTVSLNKLTNAGGITIAQDAHVTVNDFPADSFSNAGTITVDPTGTLELNDGNYTLAELDGIANHGGTVLIDGTLDLGGATIDLTADNPGSSGFELNDATLQNGTIKTDGTGIYYTKDYNTLSNVTIDGPLNVDGGANTELVIDSSSGFAAGSPVQITETAGSYLEFDGSRTLDNADLTLATSSFYVVGSTGPLTDGTLTLGPDSTLTLTGADIFGSPLNNLDATDSILDNKGTIVATTGGLESNPNSAAAGPLIENEGVFIQGGGYGSDLYQISNSGLTSISGTGSSILTEILDNTGTVDISNGSNLTISASEVIFAATGQFDNTGTVQISAGSTLTLQAGSTELGTVSFLDGTGTLTLYVGDEFVHYGHGSTDGTLNMFQSGDMLDLGPAFNDAIHHFPGDYSIAHSGNTLTVDQGGILVDSFALTGQDYSNATFTLTGDVITTDAPGLGAGTPVLTWSGAIGGNWSDPANWTPNGVPGSADTALVNLAGSYAIALDVPEIGSLTLDAAGATVTPTGPLHLDGAIDVKAGTLAVAQAIQGGTLVADGGTIDYAGGTLFGVTLDGALDLSASNAQVTIENGIAFGGGGPGQILDTGSNAVLAFDYAQTLTNVGITLGASGSYSSFSIGQSLTLAANSTLTTAGGASISGDSLDNKGSITAADGSLSDGADTTNEGSIAISDGNANSIGGLINTGTLTISGSNTSVELSGELDNTGTISVGAGATLKFGGNVSYDQIGDVVSNGGTVIFSGTLDLIGDTLDITAGSPAYSDLLLNGTIQNGTIKTDGTGIHYSGDAVLSGVTIDGILDVSGTPNSDSDIMDGQGTMLTIENGLQFTGTSPGQIVETATNSVLQFAENPTSDNLYGNQTIDNLDITLGNSYFNVPYGILTLGPSTVMTLVADENFGSGAGPTRFFEGTLVNEGTILASGGGLENTNSYYLAEGQGYLIENKGLIAVSGGTSSEVYNFANSGTLSISGAGSSFNARILDNTGIIDVSDGGRFSTSAPDEGMGPGGNFGTIELSGGAVASLYEGPGGSDQFGTISFQDNSGIIFLNDNTGLSVVPGDITAVLDMFQSGDVLGARTEIDDEPDSPVLFHSGNTLEVLKGQGSNIVLDDFALTGQDYSNATFTLTGDVITTDAPCFCAGTLILTDRGERAVEALEVGDLVVTLPDGVRTVMPIRWLGRRRVVVGRHPEPEHVDPVRIARDAIAPGLPVRDLFVSPDHALFLDGVLIQARQLVNHMTITRDSGREVVTYHHVELDRHAVLIADGMPCESYLDGGNRGQFDAQGTVVPLRLRAVGDAKPCAPLVTDAALVQPIWQRLADRARAGGHVPPVPELEGDLLSWLETADGVPLLPSGDGRHFVLPAGCLRVRLRSRSDRPTTLAPWSDDRRRLGVAISGLTLRQGRWRQELALASLRDDAGWWPLETAGDLAWRWTDGDGWIDLPEAAEAIEVTVHTIMAVPVAEAAGIAWATRARAG